ncbi:MAG: hypothetical protein ABII88_04600 [Candidatus Omnitrophota bacterium]
MKFGKILLAALVITIVDAVIGGVTCGGVFNWVYRLEPISVWRPMEGPPGSVVYAGMLVLNIIFAFVYALLINGIPGKNRLTKGLLFGLCVWAVGLLPGMFSTYIFMVVSTTVVIYWTVSGLIHIPLKGLILAAIYGESRRA